MIGHHQRMPITIRYDHDPVTSAPRPIAAQALWAMAGEVRRQLLSSHGRGAVGDDGASQAHLGLTLEMLCAGSRMVVVNGRRVQVSWDMSHEVHDGTGNPVLGVCETDPDMPESALVSINARMVAARPELALSTAAHELGHVVFDVPAALGEAGRRFRAVTRGAEVLLDPSAMQAERRANEFMGALLVPAVPLHLRMLAHARTEGLRTAHAAHHGRQGSRVLAAENQSEAVAGVIAALAGDFGVSESFIRVRLARYRLVQGGLRP